MHFEVLSILSKQNSISMKSKTDFEPVDKPRIKSEVTYPDFVADYDSCSIKIEEAKIVKQDNDDFEKTTHHFSVEKKVVDIIEMKTEHSVDTSPVEEPDSLSSNKTYSTLHSVKDEQWDEINQVKTENGLVVEVKSEIPETVNSTELENMDTLMLNEEFDIKYEHEDLTWDSAQMNKWNREQKDIQIEEEKQLFSCYNCNYTDDCKKGLIVHVKKNNCHLESNLGKLPSASRKQYRLNVCIKCNEVFKRKALLVDHMVRKHAEYTASASSKIYQCKWCDLIFVDTRQLTRHMLTHNNAKASDPHICKHCNTSFKKRQSLFDHILKKHPDFSETVSSKIYECTHCAFKTTVGSHLTRHIATHTTQKPFECMNCNASYKNKLCLDHHIVRKHPKFVASVSHKIHECTYCEYKTTYAHALAMHMMRHTGAKFPCTNCDSSFTSKRSLDNHTLHEHPEFTAYMSHKIHKCTHCEYKTTRAGDLTTHAMRHTGAKFTCTKCDASFTSKRSLDNHTLHEHPEFTGSVTHKIRKCTHCEYKTTFFHRLATHLRKHAGPLTCSECDASFTIKRSLDNHILQKHPEFIALVSHRIHECTHCEFKTTVGQSLARHIMEHTGDKFTCSTCDASFRSKLGLDNHVLQKHPEFTASVSHKIRECTHCEYKTIYMRNLTMHMTKHTGDTFPS
ncbi:unnamed protein product [Acanthoscelides obtectus]|uniref:C2H2-type domain-containing protein n=1 Tax=Acanthoscelides obtectus TaxID=200917 RepID=A0A9P0KSR8_ACAOB|nr:unnamed protein product [Acanthoscelides obtectus]CAK1676248.1 Zinc finger protein 26 [Acanthoscelides obtectus]